MSAANLVSWLPFDTSTTLDKLGNTWTATGAPAISDSALSLNGSSYLQMTGGITLGGQDFTIRGKFNMGSDSGASCRIFSFHNANQTTTNCINLARYVATANLYTDCMSSSSSNVAISLNQPHDFEYNYYHDTGTVKIFVDGVLGITLSKTIPRTNFPNVFINKSNWSADGYFVGTIDEFQIYDGVALHTANFTPPTYDDYVGLALDLDGTADFTYDADVEIDITNATQKWKWYRLVSWLPFDTSTTLDKCGNTWTAYGSPTVSGGELKLDGASCLQMTGGITLGGQDFTICGEARMSTDTAQVWGGLFAFNGNQLRLIQYNSETEALEVGIKGRVAKITTTRLTDKFHFEIDYTHSDGVWRVFFNGTLVYSKTASLDRTTYARVYVGGNGDSNASGNKWGGSIDNFMIYDGAALHTADFTPPTADDYITLVFDAGEATANFGFGNDFALDEKNSRYVEELMINDDLTAWLPFTDYPTEDYCENWWATTTSEAVINPNLSTTVRDENHGVALYLTSETETLRGQLCLNCQGMYLGGRDFSVSFDWWYGGAIPFSVNYPVGFFGSTLGDIFINNRERWSPNYQKTSLKAFEQSTAEFSVNYRTWHSMKLEYSHANSKLKLLVDDTVQGELDITIPRTFFPEVEVDRAHGTNEHGSGYISNLMIKGGDMAVGCGEVIWLAVFRNGQSTLYPFRPFEIVGRLAMAIRYDQRNWYNVLRELNDDRASDYYVLYNGTAYALTKG